MAEEMKYDEHMIKPNNESCTADAPVESTDRGVFDFMKSKKDEESKCEDDKIIASEFEEKVQVCEEKKEEHKDEEKKHEGLLEKLHRTSSSSSSSSDEEEVDENGEKKKKKKGLKEKIKDKISGDKKEGEEEKPCYEDTSVPIEKYEDVPTYDAGAEEKKGFLDKIKDKLPGGGKKVEEVAAPPPPHAVECATTSPVEAHHEGKEKKGFLDKIKEKIPGFKSDDEKEKEKEKEGAC